MKYMFGSNPFLKRRSGIKGMIVGWFASLIMTMLTALVKRIMADQMRKYQQAASRAHAARQPHGDHTSPLHRPAKSAPSRVSPQPYRQWAVQDTIYEGMSEKDVIAAYGRPLDRRSVESGQEVWTFSQRPGAPRSVTIKRGVVTDWTETDAA